MPFQNQTLTHEAYQIQFRFSNLVAHEPANFTTPQNSTCQLSLFRLYVDANRTSIGSNPADDPSGSTSGVRPLRSAHALRFGLLWLEQQSKLFSLSVAVGRRRPHARQAGWAWLLCKFRSARRRSGAGAAGHDKP